MATNPLPSLHSREPSKPNRLTWKLPVERNTSKHQTYEKRKNWHDRTFSIGKLAFVDTYKCKNLAKKGLKLCVKRLNKRKKAFNQNWHGMGKQLSTIKIISFCISANHQHKIAILYMIYSVDKTNNYLNITICLKPSVPKATLDQDIKYW